jgi:hypothetical protein
MHAVFWECASDGRRTAMLLLRCMHCNMVKAVICSQKKEELEEGVGLLACALACSVCLRVSCLECGCGQYGLRQKL